MSATAESVVVLAPRSAGRIGRVTPTARPLVRLAAFFALGLYGITRWATLMTPAPMWRLVGLLGLATLAAATLGVLAGRGRLGVPIAILGAVAVVIVALPIAGVPMRLVIHHHVGAIADGIGQGLGAMPRVLVPYSGIDQWVRVVMMLGAAVLLLDAAFVLAFAPKALGDARRAGAALPLVALAVVPSTLMRPSLPYVHGLLLLALIAALVWGERLPRLDVGAAILITIFAGAAALILAPAFDRHRPWINYQSIAGAFSPSNVAAFDWSQKYGPLTWPRTGKDVLTVQAKRGDYWKAENLDAFDGTRWGKLNAVAQTPALPPPDVSAVTQWSQEIRVTVKDMRTTDVIAAGFAGAPLHLTGGVVPGSSAGTWQASGDLGPGDTYSVSTYSPRPSHAELAAVPGYPSAPADGPLAAAFSQYLSMGVPVTTPTGTTQAGVVFAAFHSPQQSYLYAPTLTVPDVATLMAKSPYARAYHLARSLAAGAPSSIGYVERVQAYLGRGFTYNEDPPPRAHPLASFLFDDKIGYCQQFAGAMALLLRMGGVPARVSVGFTTGTYDRNSAQWVVSDLEAHAWVEAWFPRYGWVRFDPTPGAAPARGGHGSLTGAQKADGSQGPITQTRKPDPRAPTPGGAAPSHGSSAPVLLFVAGGLALALLAVFALRMRRPSSVETDRLLMELDRALSRSGRPLSPAATLAQIEHSFRSAPAAAAYVRALRVARYGSGAEPPTAAGRRAVRERLAEGLGLTGRVRALWALPPGSPTRAVSVGMLRERLRSLLK